MNDRVVKALADIYRDEGLVLALGSGVSCGSGIPTWNGLIDRLMARCFPNRRDSPGRTLQARGWGLGALAAFAQDACPAGTSFPELVRDCLYATLDQAHGCRIYGRRINPADRRRFAQMIEARNPTLAAVAAFCAVRTPAGRVTANPAVGAIVNFNIDSLLRSFMRAKYADDRRVLRTVERPSAERQHGKIDVYHVHGFLRFDGKFGRLTDEAPDRLVLTERQYYDFFSEPNSIFHYTMLYLLRSYSMLFIGLSMKDDNLRRLLYYSLREREGSYRTELKGGRPRRRKVVRHFAALPVTDCEAADRVLIARSLRELGTMVIWVRHVDEIPELLRLVYEVRLPNQWQRVYTRRLPPTA